MPCHLMGKAELNWLWDVSEDRTGNQSVAVTEAVVTFLELSNNETGCCVNFSFICPNVPKRLAKLIKDVTEYILTLHPYLSSQI